jgi:hypothetical protein
MCKMKLVRRYLIVLQATQFKSKLLRKLTSFKVHCTIEASQESTRLSLNRFNLLTLLAYLVCVLVCRGFEIEFPTRREPPGSCRAWKTSLSAGAAFFQRRRCASKQAHSVFQWPAHAHVPLKEPASQPASETFYIHVRIPSWSEKTR